MCETMDIFPLRFSGWRQSLLALRNLFSPLPLIAEKYFEPEAVARIRDLVASGRINLVHLDMLHLAKYKEVTGNLPVILVNHNVESLRLARWVQMEKNPALKCFLNYQHRKLLDFEKSMCPQFDECIVVSEHDREVLRELCGRARFQVIPNGVDTKFFGSELTSSVDESQLVWAGSMANPYNRDAVVYFMREIWPRIISRLPGAKVKFIGKSPPPEVTKAKPRSNVTYTGYVDDVRPLIAQASVFIAPLRAGSGTKIKVLNAMSQGKAVVTTTVGAEGIEARTGRDLIIADTPGDFAAQVVDLLQRPELAKEIGANGRQVVEAKYDWRIIEREIHRVYSPFFLSHAAVVRSKLRY